ncbi:MAG TPA: hypothetical protein VEY70_06970 [Metabacillus sp.]|nr:hypothetical protein [Metabacillus sp.]
MKKMTNFLNTYGKYLYAFSMAFKPCSKVEIEYMLKMYRDHSSL